MTQTIPSEIDPSLLSRLSAVDREKFISVAVELAVRRSEGLRLYRPMGKQLQFHMSYASERVVRGGVRSGKSMASFAEDASAATGVSIIGPDNNPLPFKYPTAEPLLIWCIGYDQRHIGGTIYRMLFEPGAFRIIRDPDSGEWRAWQPWREYDRDRKSETAPSLPLIPDRYIEDTAWENRGERVFTVCRLKNGTQIHAFSSKAEPKMGDPVDLIHIDEDIKYPKHVAEWQSRLADKKGRIMWSAFPHSKNIALTTLSRRAAELKDSPNPDVFEIVLRHSANPYIDDEEKEKNRKRWEAWSEEERMARDEGAFLTAGVDMYPNYSKFIHGTPNHDSKKNDDKIDTIMRQRNGEPPDDWTRILTLDPGHRVAAILLAAIPPPEFGYHVVLYDEIYGRRLDAEQLAKEVVLRVSGYVFEAFIMDFRAGRQTIGGFGKTIRQQYADAFERYALRSRLSGSSFIYGSDNVGAGIMHVRDLLCVQQDGSIKLKVYVDKMPMFHREIEHYKKQVTKEEVKDTPESGQPDHLMDCLRYLASYQPEYIKPSKSSDRPSPAMLRYREFKTDETKDPNEVTPFHMGAGASPYS